MAEGAIKRGLLGRDRSEAPPILATVNYLAEMDERPWTDVIDFTKTNIVREAVDVTVENAWPIVGDLSLEKQGFVVHSHETRVKNFRDPHEVQRVYPREMERLIADMTGAALAISPEMPVTRFSGDTASIQPGYYAHLDFVPDSLASRMLDRGVDLNAPEFSKYSRVCVYQTWRALSGPEQDSTLALTDGRTVRSSDVVESDFVRYQQKIAPGQSNQSDQDDGYNQFGLCRPNRDHRWYYFPKLKRDELLVWNGIDLSNDSMHVLHTAIKNSSATDGPPRESVEARIYAFFD